MEGNLDELTKANLPLVGKVARTFLNRGYEYEDMFQIGSIGLIKAIKRFDPERGLKFSTYAFPMIVGEIKRFLRDDWTIKVSRKVGVLGPRIHWAKSSLANELNREPTNKEIADKIGCEVKDIEAYSNASNICSLSGVIHQGEHESNDITLQDKLENDFNMEDEVIKNLEKQNLYACINMLSEKQSKVIKLRLKEKTQMEIARILGISQVQVSRLEKKSHIKLKKLMEDENLMNNKNLAFQMFEKNLSNEEVSQKLGLTIKTIEAYKTLYNKVNGLSKKTKPSKKEEAFSLFSKNMSSKEIADNLNITLSTVHSYKSEYNMILNEKMESNNELITNTNNEDKSAPAFGISEHKKEIEVKQIEAVKVKHLKPILFQGEIMEYAVTDNGIKVKSKCSPAELMVSKNNLKTLIEELQELNEVI